MDWGKGVREDSKRRLHVPPKGIQGQSQEGLQARLQVCALGYSCPLDSPKAVLDR